MTNHDVSKNKSCPPITYTAMHGVGYPFIKKTFESFNFPELVWTKQQLYADPEFTTVKFPNPEEGEGALKLAIQTAEKNGSKFILANDPDADRLAIAEKLPSGDWKIFTGDEIGTLLGYYIFCKEKEKDPNGKFAMVCSTVSLKMLKRIAEVEGFYFEDVLTGFKWIANKCIDLDKQGYKSIFSYEEAIGFCVGSMVRDKDGVSAAINIGQLYVELAEKGMSVNDYL